MGRVNHYQPEDMDVRERDEPHEYITDLVPSEDEKPGSTPTQRIGLVVGLALFLSLIHISEPTRPY